MSISVKLTELGTPSKLVMLTLVTELGLAVVRAHEVSAFEEVSEAERGAGCSPGPASWDQLLLPSSAVRALAPA